MCGCVCVCVFWGGLGWLHVYSVHVREERGDRELEYKEARQMGDAYAMIKTQIKF